MPTQAEWRYCQKCHVMFYNGLPQKFVCTGNPTVGGRGGHDAQGFVFELPYDQPETPNVQSNWRECGKCGELFWEGAQTSVCPGGGAHQPAGYNFALPHDTPETDGAQGAWRFCGKCGAMFYDGYPDKGHCRGNFTGNLLHGAITYGGHVATGFAFVLPYQHAAPPPPAAPPIQVQFTGPVWLVSLTHTQCEALEGLLTALSGAGEAVGKALSAVTGAIQAIDATGGDRGVDVQGVLGVQGMIITPHGSGMVGQLIAGANERITAAWIVDFLLLTARAVPPVGTALGIATAASVLAAVMGGISIGVALATALGIDLSGLGSSPDPNAHGGIHADRKDPPQAWELFILSQLGPNNQVALLSWQGLFSAQNGGGADVYANRPQLGEWETWTQIFNADGTVSFQAHDGKHFLTATGAGGDGSVCWANATGITNSEKFFLRLQTNGRIALQTLNGRYLSVQSGK